MWKWLIAFALLVVLLIPTSAFADTSQEVTVTATGYVVGAPSGLTLTYISDYEVGISWTKGADAENTMIRGAVGRVPESRTDGYQVYYGDGTNTSDTGVSLDETAAPVYYIAFSQNAAGVWEELGVSDSLEGFGVTTLAIMLGVLAFTFFAIWKKEAVFYMLGVIGWLFMTFYLVNRDYPEENAYLPYAIAGFCLSVTLVMAIQIVRILITQRDEQRNLPSASSIVQAEHRQKVLQLTKPRRKKDWWDE